MAERAGRRIPGVGDRRPRGGRCRRRARAVRPRPQRRRAGRRRCRIDGPHRGPPARCAHARLVRRLGGEPLRAGPAGRLPLSDGAACDAALVPRPRHGCHEVRRVRRARRALDRARRAGTRARAAGGAAVRATAPDPGPQLRRGRGGAAHRPSGAQDRSGRDGGVCAVHRRQRQGVAGARGRAGDVPLPAAERFQRPHLPARPASRRQSRARPDRADRDRPRTAPRPRRCARGRAGARVGGARGPAGRLLGSRRGHRAHAAQHSPRSVRRRRLPSS